MLIISVVIIIILTARYDIHPFLALLVAAITYGLCTGMQLEQLVSGINEGFGDTLGKVGLVILLGVIIGSFLEWSGGAYKMASFILRLIGTHRVHDAMGIIGYLVSIPVFADSGFIILSPLNKSLSKKAKVSLAGTGIALILGLMVTHTMVPPTPGPIAAAGIVNADIGYVMLFGLTASVVALLIGILFAKSVASKVYIDPNPELTEIEIEAKLRDAPSTLRSFLPIVVPIALIVGRSLAIFSVEDESTSFLLSIIYFLGSPVIALLIGVLLAFSLPRDWDRSMLSTSGLVGKSLQSASNILLITGAGGIFGTILQRSGIADQLASSMSELHLGIWLPFVIAASIKTAQGSSTVALITTASIIAPLATSLGFESEMDKALLVVAMGAGSLVVAHANDSSFWVVTQMCNMDTKTGYKLYSAGTLICGLTAALVIQVIAILIG
ncbi:MAG: gluconate:H+ symporter [Bacteroidota bacterium]